MYTQYIEYVPKTMNSLGPVMAEAMKMENSGEKTVTDCLRALQTERKCFFLVLDAVDRLYTSKHEFAAKMKILNELMMLGSQTDGSMCVFICSSVSMMTSMISREAVNDPEMLRKYPMLSDAPDLNYTKFEAIYAFVHSSSKADVVQIAMANGFPENIAQDVSGLLYFFCGDNARECSNFCKMLLAEPEVSASLASMTSKVQPKLSHKDLDVYNRLMAALVEKNKNLMKDAEDKGMWHADWFSLQALARCEVDDILRNTGGFDMALLRLVDHGLFCMSHQDKLGYLYPSSPLLLYRERAAARDANEVSKAAMKTEEEVSKILASLNEVALGVV